MYVLVYGEGVSADVDHDKLGPFGCCQISFCTDRKDLVLAERISLILRRQFVQKSTYYPALEYLR